MRPTIGQTMWRILPYRDPSEAIKAFKVVGITETAKGFSYSYESQWCARGYDSVHETDCFYTEEGARAEWAHRHNAEIDEQIAELKARRV